MDEITISIIDQLADGVPFYDLLSGYDSESLIQELAQRLRDANDEIESLGYEVMELQDPGSS
ncbi:hypothetical protein HOU67_gp32 [Escherichia phage Skarpretter]|uniref:Uncharacterized protein n=1 Tax=Escherichia phage Skarpretter TaxID=2488654 RepID=A0A3G8F3E6_9CAUD|nr:hypothetical protein HOU67_gp32 [Escherichia phage Skarpretter]AZF88668.1 hypothetical protein [Escherichia phage Skarpretter]